MTVRKWAICGLILMGLTALSINEPNIAGIIAAGIIGILKGDSD